MTNLLAGVLGFTVAGICRTRNRTEHLAWVAATVWVFNLPNIALGIQTSTSWIRSGLTLILMATLGGTLAMILRSRHHLIAEQKLDAQKGRPKSKTGPRFLDTCAMKWSYSR